MSGGQSGNCLELTRTGASNQYAKQTNVTLVVGKLYKFSFYVKSGTSGNEAFTAYCYDGTTVHSVSGTSTGSWVQYTKVFEMGGSDSTLNEITLSKSTATAGTMLFDTVSLYEVTPACIAGDDKACDTFTKLSATDIYRQHTDSTYTKDGSFYSLKMVSSGNANGDLRYTIDDPYTLALFKGRKVTAGAWVKTDAASQAKLNLLDDSGNNFSSLNTGTGWEWLEVTATVSTSATYLALYFFGTNTKTVYISQPMLVLGSSIGEGNYTRPNGEIILFEAKADSTKYHGKTGANGFSDHAIAVQNLEADSNGKIPKGIKAVYLTTLTRDSASSTTGTILTAGPDALLGYAVYQNSTHGLANDTYGNSEGIVPCDANGDIYIYINASGSNTFDIDTFYYYGVQLK